MLCGYESELGLSEPQLPCVEDANNGPRMLQLHGRGSCHLSGLALLRVLGHLGPARGMSSAVSAFLAPPVLNSTLSTLVASGTWGLVSLPDMLTRSAIQAARTWKNLFSSE